MIYLEFIDWERRIPVDIFRHLAKQDGWVGEAEDEQIINVGRHKGLGPSPAYLCGWRIRELSRMDEWDVYFKSAEGRTDYAELAAFHGLQFVRCGLYDELLSGVLPNENMHFAEYFDAPPDISDDDVRAHFEGRAERYPRGALTFLFRRVGRLGPDAADIAVWTFADFASIEPIAREAHRDCALRPHTVGVYKNVGHELM